jgi:hypothetical protein
MQLMQQAATIRQLARQAARHLLPPNALSLQLQLPQSSTAAARMTSRIPLRRRFAVHSM